MSERGRRMFCSQCGEKLEENEKFCHKCGAPVYKNNQTAGNQGAGNFSMAVGKKAYVKRPYLLVAAVLCIVFVVIGIWFAGSRGYKKPVQVFMEGIEKQDLHQAASVLFPKEVEQQLGMNLDWLENSMLSNITAKLGESAGFSLDYKITGAKRCTRNEIEEMQKKYNRALMTDVKLKDAKRLDVKLQVSAGGEQKESTGELVVIKVCGKWYINVVELI